MNGQRLDDNVVIQLACTRLVHRLYGMLDQHDYGALDEVFAPDAAWTRLGQCTLGLGAITALMRQRPSDLVTRHLIGNAVVDADGPDRAHGSFYMTVLRCHGVAADAPRPLFIAGPWRMSVLRTRFRRTPAGWRIAAQETDTQFEFGPVPEAACA